MKIPHSPKNSSFSLFAVKKIRVSFLGLGQIPLNYPQFPPKIRLSHPKRQGQRHKKQHNSSKAPQNKRFKIDYALNSAKRGLESPQKYSPFSSAAIKRSCWTTREGGSRSASKVSSRWRIMYLPTLSASLLVWVLTWLRTLKPVCRHFRIFCTNPLWSCQRNLSADSQ